MKLWTKVEQPMDARVVVPYIKATPLLQTVVDALRIQYVQPEVVKLSKRDNGEYHALLKRLWSEGQEFFIVEHDVLPWTGSIKTMADCVEPWCSMPQICDGKLVLATFGCVKFGRALIHATPGIWDTIDPTPWYALDLAFEAAAKERMAGLLSGEDRSQVHAHFPVGTHINEAHWPAAITGRDGSHPRYAGATP